MSHDLPLVREMRALLQTRRFARTVRGYQTLDSTNTTAMRWAHEGAEEGSIVIAEHQTAGRGRQGRAWEAAAGQNLMFSVVLRPALSPSRLNVITLAASIALAETIETFTAPLTTAIKWPNDILLEGYKCCGMLLESTLAGAARPLVILGIGINVNQPDFPPALEHRATSLLLQTGRRTPRAALLSDLLGRLEQYYDGLGTKQEAAVHTAYRNRLYRLGHPITLRLTEQDHPLTGTLLGVTDTGALRLDTDQGIRIFHAGDVTLDFRSAKI